MSQSLWNRAMSFDKIWRRKFSWDSKSQSLWNRAMSFDEYQGVIKERLAVSIPLEQGNVFRLQWGVRALCGKASQSHFPTFSDV